MCVRETCLFCYVEKSGALRGYYHFEPKITNKCNKNNGGKMSIRSNGDEQAVI